MYHITHSPPHTHRQTDTHTNTLRERGKGGRNQKKPVWAIFFLFFSTFDEIMTDVLEGGRGGEKKKLGLGLDMDMILNYLF